MKKTLLSLTFIFLSVAAFTQYTVRLVVTNSATKKLEDIYATGTFNNWNPNDAGYKLKPFGGTRKAIVLKNVAPGHYEFKFTRGSFEKVETAANGTEIDNHIIEVSADTTMEFFIKGWKDDYPDKVKPFTATEQVSLMDSAFFIPQLNRTRKIWIYLPKSYNQTKGKAYPVLYMQDGQNLFNERTAAFGEWGIDECLDSLSNVLHKECIVIGIENGGDKRMTEYNPFDSKYGKGEGAQYVDFLAQTLKPYIDKQYRTLKDPAHTYIAGSSMGAIISLYAMLKYSNVFGAVGVFSPSFQVVPQMYDEVQKTKWTTNPRFFFYAGNKESETMVNDMKKMTDLISTKSKYDIREVTFPLGQHNEETWRRYFPEFYRWLVR
ncbi:alpha/beta hydrolase-fold protein [Danxiaibacter flavus]|uniref:Alpha/beta hydrolase-fold protein n=2 Tax=Danxiaibacter flavus TaxID=3049108 RepID=A0ABV3ZC08_9BACT